MPLKLVPPRKGKSPNWSIRGTYLGVAVDRTARTDRRSLAARVLRDIERQIECGEFAKSREPAAPSFLSAALAYIKARRPKRDRARYIGRLCQHFGETPIDAIDQAAIDSCALALYPNVSPASRNAYVYIPLSAILKMAGRRAPISRPKGFQGRTVTDYLPPEDAFAIIAAAETFDREFALLLRFLLYTGVRIGEALALRPEHVDTERRRAWVRKSKNGKPRTLVLRADLCEELATHKPTDPGKFFRLRQGGHLAHSLMRAKLLALGLPCPRRRPVGWRVPPNRLDYANFHTFRHTWATWMRQYGGADVQGLVATGNWSHVRSASRYAHVVARDEWQRVEDLPAPGGETVEQDREAG